MSQSIMRLLLTAIGRSPPDSATEILSALLDCPEPTIIEDAQDRYAALNAEAASDGALALYAGEEARCALELSSVRTWVAMLHGTFVLSLVDCGLWTPHDALWMDRVGGFHPRDLAALCAYLLEPERTATRRLALERARETESESGLSAVAEYFEGAERLSVLREAVSAARADINPTPRMGRLLKLSERFPEPERSVLGLSSN